MSIFWIILVSILSMLASVGIALKGSFDMFMIFPKKGYLLNTDKIKNKKIKINNIELPNKSIALLCIPVVNMVYTSWLMHYVSIKLFDECKKQPGILIPMTDEEKKEFKSRKGYLAKFDYYMKLSADIIKQEVIDADSFEVISDTVDSSEATYNNPVLNKYRRLRDEVIDINQLNNELDNKDDYTLNKKL